MLSLILPIHSYSEKILNKILLRLDILSNVDYISNHSNQDNHREGVKN
jgi:hypothetical protein